MNGAPSPPCTDGGARGWAGNLTILRTRESRAVRGLGSVQEPGGPTSPAVRLLPLPPRASATGRQNAGSKGDRLRCSRRFDTETDLAHDPEPGVPRE